jgi:hypothetical protein
LIRKIDEDEKRKMIGKDKNAKKIRLQKKKKVSALKKRKKKKRTHKQEDFTIRYQKIKRHVSKIFSF